MINKLLKSNYLSFFVLLLFIILIYGQCLSFGYAIDDQLINEHIPGRVEGISGLFRIFLQRYDLVDYRPIVILSYAIEKWIFGESFAYVSHFVNLLLFYFTLIVMLRMSSTYIQKPAYNNLILISLLFFTVHPVHVEVISSLKCRDNLLSFLFSVISVNFTLRYYFRQKSILNLIISSMFFLIAIFSKLDAVGLIFFIPVILFLSEKIKIKSTLIYIFLLYTFFNFIRFNLVNSFVPIEQYDVKNAVSFTENPLIADYTLLNRIAATALTFWYYLKMLIVPFGYRYYYGFDIVKLYPFFSWQSIVAIVSALSISLIALKYLYKVKTLFVCFLGYLFFLLYALNFITPVAGIIADRYIYMSSLFFCILVCFGLYKIIRNEKVFYSVLAILIIILGYMSFIRATAWKDKLTLIERDAPYLHNSFEGMRIATATYIEYADKETLKITRDNLLHKAIDCAKSGNQLYPQNILLNKLYATAYFKLNNYSKAKKIFQTVIKNNASDYESYNFLGDIFYLEKKPDSAFHYYAEALARNKNDATLISNMSSILYEKGDKKGCLDFNERLLAENKTLYAAWENLGYYYLQEKDTAKAAEYFENGFKHGLQNPEISQLISSYKNRNSFKKY